MSSLVEHEMPGIVVVHVQDVLHAALFLPRGLDQPFQHLAHRLLFAGVGANLSENSQEWISHSSLTMPAPPGAWPWCKPR